MWLYSAWWHYIVSPSILIRHCWATSSNCSHSQHYIFNVQPEGPGRINQKYRCAMFKLLAQLITCRQMNQQRTPPSDYWCISSTRAVWAKSRKLILLLILIFKNTIRNKHYNISDFLTSEYYAQAPVQRKKQLGFRSKARASNHFKFQIHHTLYLLWKTESIHFLKMITTIKVFLCCRF